MKITKSQLKRVIKEELTRVLNEQDIDPWGMMGGVSDSFEDASSMVGDMPKELQRAIARMAAELPADEDAILAAMADDRAGRPTSHEEAVHQDVQTRGGFLDRLADDVLKRLGADPHTYGRRSRDRETEARQQQEFDRREEQRREHEEFLRQINTHPHLYPKGSR